MMLHQRPVAIVTAMIAFHKTARLVTEPFLRNPGNQFGKPLTAPPRIPGLLQMREELSKQTLLRLRAMFQIPHKTGSKAAGKQHGPQRSQIIFVLNDNRVSIFCTLSRIVWKSRICFSKS